MGSLEAWLLLRSLKTLHLRVPRQSETATVLAKWLQSVSKTASGQSFEGIPGGLVKSVWHSSLQGTDARGFNPQSQMTGGYNPTFSIAVSCNHLWSGAVHVIFSIARKPRISLEVCTHAGVLHGQYLQNCIDHQTTMISSHSLQRVLVALSHSWSTGEGPTQTQTRN